MSAVPFAVCVVEHFHCCYYCLHIARYVRWLASAVYNVYVVYILLLYSLCNNGNKRIVTSHMAGPRDSHEFQLISSIGSEWCGFECFIVLTLLCWMFFFFSRLCENPLRFGPLNSCKCVCYIRKYWRKMVKKNVNDIKIIHKKLTINRIEVSFPRWISFKWVKKTEISKSNGEKINWNLQISIELGKVNGKLCVKCVCVRFH